ncbi:ATP-binding protein [Candidatus Izemoplasma sp. B36]|uniref:ATP-binding protein n=1 Tax=Candidatus Izemoplasma sp. B36 TaxID=3242468 RepID=UPI003556D098
MINRPNYMNTLINALDNGMVKLLVGVRRSGKSTLLKLLKEYIINMGVIKKQVIEINFEMIENDYLKDKEVLHKYISDCVKNNKSKYLFIDEVQEIPEWARVLNSLRVSFDIDIYVTGSNARVFTGEHLTYLAGRYLSINVYPLSFFEVATFLNKKTNIDIYNTFLDSSFPGVLLEPKKEIKNIMKQDLFDTIFQRDMILKGKIRNESIFFKVVRYVLEHIGSMVSINKIRNTLVSDGIKISYEAVDNYINLMVKSYFLYPCLRYDIKGKEILKTNNKYYVVDFGIRNKIIPNVESNTGRILENFIYLELIKHGYDVYIGKVGRDYEIDFLATKEERRMFIQVSETIVDPKTREREIKPFTMINEIGERYVVSLDKYQYSSEYFKHLYLIDFIDIL